MPELFKRWPLNPILTPENWPYPANAVFNPGAVRFGDRILLLVRVEDFRGFSHLTVATSPDGKTGWDIEERPTLKPEPDKYPEEMWGIEDPRIVLLEDGVFAITYVAYSWHGPTVCLALTEDFVNFRRLGPVLPPGNKNASLFPKRFKGRWLMINRIGNQVCISYSQDLKNWENHTPIMEPRPGGWWDSYRIGLGPPPIETPEGWLVIYHGVKKTVAGEIYRVGLALLDLEDPTRVIRRGDEWVLSPRATYERVGDVPNVVFPCGAVTVGEDLFLYYGAADTYVALAYANIRDLLDYLSSSS
ncbi:glycosidase PH1107-related protein [Thermocrinis albus DSM 14484]|uniref:Glycosidase PH1107-related protein n=1 Tax=Thermocrinis albus (strain DSM 14484 / JCM 11386 / HI 11/12) TaxID=638303 RepID=D3SMP0_THEAH|nr:glycosidase [Thermocrinis albus]ADC90020.1 glycosidase PH1107-related protein [Thermocrinis albus DSM 14484]